MNNSIDRLKVTEVVRYEFITYFFCWNGAFVVRDCEQVRRALRLDCSCEDFALLKEKVQFRGMV